MREDADSTWIDISIPLSSAVPVWPGDTPFSCGWIARREDGSSVNLGVIHSSAHAATHADAPLHVDSSWPASESLPIEPFVGSCRVVSMREGRTGDNFVDVDELRALVDDSVPARLLLRTGVSVTRGTFPDSWPAITDECARWLVNSGMRLFGVDAPSVDERNSKTLPVHHTLFGSDAFILENLSLSHVQDGVYELMAQPLSTVGADAAPVRALLRRRTAMLDLPRAHLQWVRQ